MSAISEPIRNNPERTLLFAAYSGFGDHSRRSYHDWQCRHTGNEMLDLLYGYLEQLGYEMSDEEKSYRNGEHELFHESEQGA